MLFIASASTTCTSSRLDAALVAAKARSTAHNTSGVTTSNAGLHKASSAGPSVPVGSNDLIRIVMDRKYCIHPGKTEHLVHNGLQAREFE